MRRRAVLAGLTAISLVGLRRPVRAAQPVRLGFAELYDEGTFSAKCRELAGRTVAMRGRLAPGPEGETSLLLLTDDGSPDVVAIHPASLADVPPFGGLVEVAGRLELGGFPDPAADPSRRVRLLDARLAAIG
ncbi:MAG: hypothetical protein U1E53_25880 [Dongiaceae bacterium]